MLHCPSHGFEKPAKLEKADRRLQPGHVFINAVADALADGRAETAQLPGAVVASVRTAVKEADLVLRRAVSIAVTAAAAAPLKKFRRVRRRGQRARQLRRLLARSQHAWRPSARGWACSSCGRTVKVGSKRAASVLGSACAAAPRAGPAGEEPGPAAPPPPPAEPPPPPAPGGQRLRLAADRHGRPLDPVGPELWDRLGWFGPERPAVAGSFLGGRPLGEGHALWLKGSYTFCGACGAWATQRALSLLGPCSARDGAGRLRKSQLDALSRLRRGKPPRQGAASWWLAADQLPLAGGLELVD